MRRRVLLSTAAVLAVLVAVGAGVGLTRGSSASDELTGTAVDRAVPPLPLVDASGKKTSLAAFHGKVLVLAPSMTLCHELCPLTTASLIRMQRAVARAGLGDRVAFAEATVDPWRDSPARLRAYARMTGSHFQLLTGSPAQIARLWKFFGVGYERVPQDDPPDVDWLTGKPETFDVEHTDGLFFVDPSGRERRVIVGMSDVGGHLSPALAKLLSDEGRRNLEHPRGAWTVEEALADLSHLLGEPIAEPT